MNLPSGGTQKAIRCLDLTFWEIRVGTVIWELCPQVGVKALGQDECPERVEREKLTLSIWRGSEDPVI